MTPLLEQGIKASEVLAPEIQDIAGAILLELAARPSPHLTLTPEQIEDVKLAIADADRGEFASDEEVEELWRRFSPVQR